MYVEKVRSITVKCTNRCGHIVSQRQWFLRARFPNLHAEHGFPKAVVPNLASTLVENGVE
jgi:hypothetical protein